MTYFEIEQLFLKHNFSLNEIHKFTFGETVCRLDVVVLKEGIDQYEAQYSQIAGSLAEARDKKDALKNIELQIKTLMHNFDELQVI